LDVDTVLADKELMTRWATIRTERKFELTGKVKIALQMDDKDAGINLVHQIIKPFPTLIHAIDVDSINILVAENQLSISLTIFCVENAEQMKKLGLEAIEWARNLTVPVFKPEFSIPCFAPRSKGNWTEDDLKKAILKADKSFDIKDIAYISLRDHVTTIFVDKTDAAIKLTNLGWFTLTKEEHTYGIRCVAQKDFKTGYICTKIGDFAAALNVRVIISTLNFNLEQVGSQSRIAFAELPRNNKRQFYGYVLLYSESTDKNFPAGVTGKILGNQLKIKERGKKKAV